CIANYTLAVDRGFKRQGDEQTADFIRCVAMGKGGEFAEKYLHQGTKIVVEGRIQTGSYTNKDGQKIFTTEVWVESQEFAESKAASAQNGNQNASAPTRPNVAQNDSDGFMNIPDAIEEELPFATN
ncbi:MAG: single-stranded DNA-binding protein, partial [Clostridium sp.]